MVTKSKCIIIYWQYPDMIANTAKRVLANHEAWWVHDDGSLLQHYKYCLYMIWNLNMVFRVPRPSNLMWNNDVNGCFWQHKFCFFSSMLQLIGSIYQGNSLIVPLYFGHKLRCFVFINCLPWKVKFKIEPKINSFHQL